MLNSQPTKIIRDTIKKIKKKKYIFEKSEDSVFHKKIKSNYKG